ALSSTQVFEVTALRVSHGHRAPSYMIFIDSESRAKAENGKMLLFGVASVVYQISSGMTHSCNPILIPALKNHVTSQSHFVLKYLAGNIFPHVFYYFFPYCFFHQFSLFQKLNIFYLSYIDHADGEMRDADAAQMRIVKSALLHLPFE
ncbi:hypothetical protein ACJX0J_038796, partial [Zea mays]